MKYLYYLLCREYAYYCFTLGSNCSLIGCRHSFVNMAVYLHTDQWSVNPLSQVVRPLIFAEISTTYKSRWYDNDRYNPLSIGCSLLIGQQLRPTHDSYDQHMTVTITQMPQLRPTDVFEKWQLRPTIRNQNTPIVAKLSSAISITAVEVECYLLPCIRTWLCQLILLLVDDILVCLDSPFSAGAILVGGNCGCS